MAVIATYLPYIRAESPPLTTSLVTLSSSTRRDGSVGHWLFG